MIVRRLSEIPKHSLVTCVAAVVDRTLEAVRHQACVRRFNQSEAIAKYRRRSRIMHTAISTYICGILVPKQPTDRS